MSALLDRTDWKILLEYDKDPFQSYHAISKTVGVHHSTVADRISSMKEKNILRKDGIFQDPSRGGMKRPTSEVIGHYSPASLGLERVHVLFRRIETTKDYDKLYTYCDNHPYTHYLTRLYGSGVTLYAQFDIPKGTVNLLRDAFRDMVGTTVHCSAPDIYRDQYEVRAIPNYQSAREIRNESSINMIDTHWEEFLENRSDIPLEKPTQKRKFDNIDAELIRELSINAKMKISELTDHFGLNKSTLSRRVARIRENNVSHARLIFGPTADRIMGFNNTQIVTGTFKEDSELQEETFLKFIKSENIFPFDAYITVDNDRFLLFTQAAIGVTGDLMQFLYENSNPYDLNQYQFYLSKAVTYYFYHENYDEDSGFKTSPEYIKGQPLRGIQ